MTPTPAAAASTAAARRSGRFRGHSVSIGRAEYRQLNRIFLACAFRASDFLRFVYNNALKLRFAFVADIFVDRHDDSLKRFDFNEAGRGFRALPTRRCP